MDTTEKQTREVGGFVFERCTENVWAFWPIEHRRAVVVRPYGATNFVVSWFAYSHAEPADASRFAAAIGAAAELAKQLNEESK